MNRRSVRVCRHSAIGNRLRGVGQSCLAALDGKRDRCTSPFEKTRGPADLTGATMLGELAKDISSEAVVCAARSKNQHLHRRSAG